MSYIKDRMFDMSDELSNLLAKEFHHHKFEKFCFQRTCEKQIQYEVRNPDESIIAMDMVTDIEPYFPLFRRYRTIYNEYLQLISRFFSWENFDLYATLEKKYFKGF